MTILKLNNISLNFPGTNKRILDDINYHIYAGDFIILAGSNGSGKSTLFKLLYRQYNPHAGYVQLLDKPIDRYSFSDYHRHVAILTQDYSESLFNSLTVYENYLLKSLNHKHNKDYLTKYIADFNHKLADKLDQPVNLLSGGEKQALALALCLLNPPTLLLLDEHSSALDPKTSDQIMKLTYEKIKQYNITCVLATHDLNIILNYGNRILMLDNGKIVKQIEHDEKLLLTKEILLANYSERKAAIGLNLVAQ